MFRDDEMFSDDERLLTKKEATWVKRFKRCINDMPKTIELSVGHGRIVVSNNGAFDRATSDGGSSDQLICIEYIRTSSIYPDSESR